MFFARMFFVVENTGPGIKPQLKLHSNIFQTRKCCVSQFSLAHHRTDFGRGFFLAPLITKNISQKKHCCTERKIHSLSKKNLNLIQKCDQCVPTNPNKHMKVPNIAVHQRKLSQMSPLWFKVSRRFEFKDAQDEIPLKCMILSEYTPGIQTDQVKMAIHHRSCKSYFYCELHFLW